MHWGLTRKLLRRCSGHSQRVSGYNVCLSLVSCHIPSNIWRPSLTVKLSHEFRSWHQVRPGLNDTKCFRTFVLLRWQVVLSRDSLWKCCSICKTWELTFHYLSTDISLSIKTLLDEFEALFTENFQFEFPGVSKSFSNLGLFGLSDIQQKCQYPRLFSWKVHLKCGAVDWVTNGRIQSCMLFWRVLSTEKTEFCKYHSLLASSACDDAEAKKSVTIYLKNPPPLRNCWLIPVKEEWSMSSWRNMSL